MKFLLFRLGALGAVLALAVPTPGPAQLLGTAGSYGVLGSTTVTNTGNTVITGSLGVSPGTALTGFLAVDSGPGLVTGTIDQGNAVAAQARADASAAYLTLANLSYTADLTGMDLGGLTLVPGVYRFSSSAQLTGNLTLDAQGDANARFVFQIGSTFTTASDSSVTLINRSLSPDCGPDNGLFWQIGSSAAIGTGSNLVGNLLAQTSITLGSGANLDFGRALALTGTVTLDNNLIDASDVDGGFCLPGGTGITPVPEPGTYGLAGCLVLLIGAVSRRSYLSARRSRATAATSV